MSHQSRSCRDLARASQAGVLGASAMLVAALFAGCPNEEPPPIDDLEAMNQTLAALPTWPEPAAEAHTETPLDPEQRSLDVGGESVEFLCERVQHDVSRHHDEVLNLGGAQTALKPGLLLQGAAFQQGVLRTIPLDRAPVTLSIDLPVGDAAITVDAPNTATLQAAVSTLQVRAGAIEGDLPAMVSYQRNEVESIDEMALKIGAHSAYDGLLVDASFDASMALSQTRRQSTVVARLIQPMYTIAFADDAIATPGEFWADSVTADDLDEQIALGNLNDDNLPVFVSSVTYGRMVVFTATSAQAASALQVQAALDLSVASYQGGFEIDADAQTFLSSLEIQVLALGGNSSAVSQAIVSGDYSLLFSNPDASTAVPLRYVVRNLAGNRPVARLGDATRFVVEECTAISAERGWQPIPGPAGTLFRAVTVNKLGDAWAAGDDGTYRFDPDDGAHGAWVLHSPDLFNDITVDDHGAVFGVDAQHRPWRLTDPTTTTWEMGGGALLQLSVTNDGLLYGIGTDSRPYKAAWPTWNLVNRDWTFHDIAMASTERLYGISGVRGNPGSTTFWVDLNFHSLHVASSAPILQQLAAPSTAEVYGLTNAFEIVAYDLAGNAWVDPGVDPVPEAVQFLAAGSNADLWIVTGSGRVFRYLP